MPPYRDASATEVLEALTRDGMVKLEVAPRHVVLEVEGASRVTVTDSFLTVVKTDRRGRKKRPRSHDLSKRRVLVARAVPTDDIGIWYESKPDVMHRIFGITPPELLDDRAFEAWKELDRLYQRLAVALAPQPDRPVRAAEYGRGADRVLVEDLGDRDAIYIRPMFRERPRKVAEVRDDGRVVFVTRRGEEVVECGSRYRVTVHGDNINFAGVAGVTEGHLWLPWIDEEDRLRLARRLGERVHQAPE